MRQAGSLSLISYFADKPYLTLDNAHALAESFQPMTLEKREALLTTGDVWDSVVFIESGLLRLFYLTEEGKEFNKGFFAEGELLWPMAPLAREQPSLFSIESIEHSQIWYMSFQKFQSHIAQYTGWAEFALSYVEQLANQKYLREYQFLVHDAKTRYELLRGELSHVIDRLPDYHLASYLGITPVALSRMKLKYHTKS